MPLLWPCALLPLLLALEDEYSSPLSHPELDGSFIIVGDRYVCVGGWVRVQKREGGGACLCIAGSMHARKALLLR